VLKCMELVWFITHFNHWCMHGLIVKNNLSK
jgi:hypothetical protein